MRGLLSLILSFLLYFNATNTAVAQYPVLDQEPASQQWYQANTAKFRIIYQKGNDSVAIELGRKLQSWYKPLSSSLSAYPKKLSVVLRNQTTVPNGFVTLAPRRSEFFTMPPQDYNFAGTNQWLDLLAIHEYRHVVQFEKARTGFSKFLYYAFGEEALAGMAFIAVPQWFWEGDAVAMETVLTPSGRGRIPEFNMAFRANLLEHGAFSYNKQYLGSFGDYIPDHYVTGYYMVTHLRRKYFKNPWDDILENAFGKPLIPFTFSRAIKKETGRNVVKTYQQMTVEMDSLWLQQVQQVDTTAVTTITPVNRKAYTNYMFPQVTLQGDILALKSGISDITQLVRINKENEENREVVTGFIANSGMLSSQKGLVVWSEYRPDLRWGARTSNEIKLYDLRTGKIRSITGPSRYSAAALSPDATMIATVYVSEENACYLVILDVATGEEIDRFINPQNHFISMPRWSEDGQSIVALSTSDAGKTIILADVATGAVEELLPRAHENYGHPVKHGQYVLYNSAYNGIDNIFALDLSSGEQYQVTSRPYGAFNPALDLAGDTLYFNDYQVMGMEVAKIPFLPDTWKPLSQTEDLSVKYYQPLLAQEQKITLNNNIQDVDTEVKKYNNFNNLFNIHSWGLLLTESGNELAVGIRSRDILSTSIFSTGYAFNPFEKTGYGYGRISYQGWFPIVDLDARIGRRSVREKFTVSDSSFIEDVEWNEKHVALGLRVPLNFTHSKYAQTLVVGAKAGLTWVDNYNISLRKADQQANGLLQPFEYNLLFNRLLKRSKRDIYSRWGQVLEGGYEHTPFAGDYRGSIAYVQAELYNPGLFKHHSFFVRGGYQYQNIQSNYRFQSNLFYPRGYGYTAFENFYLTSFNYTLPLFYPDWSIGPFFYFQRLRANAFHDLGWGTAPGIAKTFSLASTGLEVSVDFNFMRFLPLFSLGLRHVYLHEQNRYETQLLIGAIGI